MTREEILKKINYNGKYTKEVKSNLKKLIIKYHPDHNGDSEVFKLLNSIKKDLDNGKVINIEEPDVKSESVIKNKSEYLEKIKNLKFERDSIKEKLERFVATEEELEAHRQRIKAKYQNK
mgnify:CR=1 FL=1